MVSKKCLILRNLSMPSKPCSFASLEHSVAPESDFSVQTFKFASVQQMHVQRFLGNRALVRWKCRVLGTVCAQRGNFWAAIFLSQGDFDAHLVSSARFCGRDHDGGALLNPYKCGPSFSLSTCFPLSKQVGAASPYWPRGKARAGNCKEEEQKGTEGSKFFCSINFCPKMPAWPAWSQSGLIGCDTHIYSVTLMLLPSLLVAYSLWCALHII